ncbi:RNA dependent RNA polymerase-domain-containing protein [Mycena sanguinolenta]|nr:RNA dependent RNA polymerase-domain-containing protein [Mycena sanguinolenta]
MSLDLPNLAVSINSSFYFSSPLVSLFLCLRACCRQLDDIDRITVDRERALDCVDGEVKLIASIKTLADHDMNEPYLASQLRYFQNTTREKLRTKLNIAVKRSAYFLGVVDHCGVLKEGEVYINVPTKGGPQVGPVAMMRNPAYDPDGVRVLEAVNRPELKHLTNCIVFAASGDMDGDTYFVIFDPSLIPERRAANVTVAIKKPAPSKTIVIGGRAQTVSRTTSTNKDMRTAAIKTFLTMRRNFLLGSLSNEWMALVGTMPELADSRHDIVKSRRGLAILKDDFERFKITNSDARAPVNWTNLLERLAGLVPKALETGKMPGVTPC